jgi:DnaJ-domain-containing protein 1
MGIGKRLVDFAKSELNSLLDRAAEIDDDLRGDEWGGDLERMSEAELEAELERRRRAREEAEAAATGTKPRPEAQAGGPHRAEPPRRTAAGDAAIRRAYTSLEVPPGSDFETVRKAYRRLMRKYHPDLHRGSAQATRDANEIAQRLTESYKLLEKQLRK